MNEAVSIIIPTHNDYRLAEENVRSCLQQRYSPLEVVICDDSDPLAFSSQRDRFLSFVLSNADRVRYLDSALFDRTGRKVYGLARARNQGVIAARGSIIVFIDQRLRPSNEDVVHNFVSYLGDAEKKWVFGDKGKQKDTFVENFSAVRRSALITAGMFCESINVYGGLTDEIVRRFSAQGFIFQYCPSAKAREVKSSRRTPEREAEIALARQLLSKLYPHGQ